MEVDMPLKVSHTFCDEDLEKTMKQQAEHW